MATMRFAAELAVALASAIACALAFPPTGWWWLGWVAYAPLLMALRRTAGPGRALLLAWAWLTLFAYAVGAWFPRAVSVYYDQPALVGTAFFVGVSSLMAGVQYMGFAACYRALAARWPRAVVPLLAAAGWVVADAARVALFTGCPWGLPGYAQVPVAPLVQIADLTGVFGVTFAVVAVNAALAELWLATRDGAPLRPAMRGLAGAAGVVAVLVGYGLLRLRTPLDDDPTAPLTRIAVVQGNLDLGAQWRAELYGQNLEVYLRLTHEALRASGARLVIWPESAMTFFLDREPLYRSAIARVTRPHGAQLVAGGPRAVGDERPAFYNSAFLLTPDGTIVGHYDKVQLLPFAEYFPFPGLEGLQRRFGRVRQFAHGAPTPLLETVAGRAGILVCNEAMFGRTAAARVRDGAEYLVTLANDSWVGDAQFSAMTFDMVRLRAVETRRWVVRASTSGPSAIVDPFGRVVDATPTASRDTLAGAVRARNGMTPYARTGDVFVLACLCVVGGALVAGRRRQSAPPPGSVGGDDDDGQGPDRDLARP